jgi:hypothetical protein
MRKRGKQQFVNKFAAVNRRPELVGKVLSAGEIHRFVINKEESPSIPATVW